jgi:hypothetical protein
MAAMLQYFAQTALKRATLFAKEGPVTCAELQRAIEEMGWPKQSGLLRVHIVGAAMDVGGDDEGDGDGGDDEEAE